MTPPGTTTPTAQITATVTAAVSGTPTLVPTARPVLAYPNPAKDELHLAGFSHGEVITVAIYNSIGELVLSETQTRFSVASLAPGFYYYVITYTQQGSKKTMKGKFVKQ